MTAGEFPVEVLRDQAAARVEALRGVLAEGGALVAAELAVSPRAFPEELERLAIPLTPVLARRGREAAGLGPEHVLLAGAGRIVLAVPPSAREAVVEALRRDARAVLDGTGDAVAVDVAFREVQAGAIEAGGEGSLLAALDALLERDLAEAELRRAEGAPTRFWTPDPASPDALRELLDQPEFGLRWEDGALRRGEGASPASDAQARAVGDAAASIAVVRLDLDAVGRALHAVADGKPAAEGLRDRLAFLAAIRVAGALAERALAGAEGAAPPVPLPDGSFVLAGAWPAVVDAAVAARDAIAPYLAEVATALGGERAARFLDVSAGVAVGAPDVSLSVLHAHAELELRHAKGVRRTRHGDRRKAALSWRGVAVGWDDLRLAADLGRALGDAIARGQVRRGFLRRIAGLHALWRRAELSLDEGAPRAAAAASKRRWVWAHELGKAQRGLSGEGARLAARVAKLALENVDDGAAGGPRRTEQDAAAWLGLVAEIAAERARTRREERG